MNSTSGSFFDIPYLVFVEFFTKFLFGKSEDNVPEYIYRKDMSMRVLQEAFIFLEKQKQGVAKLPVFLIAPFDSMLKDMCFILGSKINQLVSSVIISSYVSFPSINLLSLLRFFTIQNFLFRSLIQAR